MQNEFEKKRDIQCMYSNERLTLSHKNGILGSLMSHLKTN